MEREAREIMKSQTSIHDAWRQFIPHGKGKEDAPSTRNATPFIPQGGADQTEQKIKKGID